MILKSLKYLLLNIDNRFQDNMSKEKQSNYK